MENESKKEPEESSPIGEAAPPIVQRFPSWEENEGLDTFDQLVSPTPLPALTEPPPPTQQDNTNDVEEESNSMNENQHLLSSFNSQIVDAVGEGLDAADAEGVEDLLESNHSQNELDSNEEEDDACFQSENNDDDDEEGEEDGIHTVQSFGSVGEDGEETMWHQESMNTPIPRKMRLVRRDLVFHQSSAHLNVSNSIDATDAQTKWDYRKIIAIDWFDSFLALRTWMIMVTLLLVFTVQMLFFAALYYAASIDCETTDPMDFATSFAFSLEIAVTVGYTLPQSNAAMFFNGCGSWITIIYFQCLVCLVLNGVLLGLIILRLSRADRRALQIIFSDKACVTCVQGRFYFTFQCFDLQAKHPIVGAKVRIVAVFHELHGGKKSSALWQTRSMRINRPDDELGSRLFLSLPCIVFHEIDSWSPLAPSSISRPPSLPFGTAANRFPQTPQRSVDARVGSRSQCTCLVCGSLFLTESALRRHVSYCAKREELMNIPLARHRGLDTRRITRPVVSRVSTAVASSSAGTTATTTTIPNAAAAAVEGAFMTVTPEEIRNQIEERFRQRSIEVVCLIEGTDSFTGNSFQARHSYCIEDLVFDSQHSPCLELGVNGGARVNLSDFHKTWKGSSNFEEAIAYPSFT